MRDIRFLIPFVAAGVTTLGWGGVAWARPGLDGSTTPHREGALPRGVLRSEIVVRIGHADGPDTVDRLRPAQHEARASATERHTSRTTGDHAIPVQFTSGVIVHMANGDSREGTAAIPFKPFDDDGEDPKPMRASLGGRSPIALRSEIAQKVLWRDEPEASHGGGSTSAPRTLPGAARGQGGLSSGTLAKINAVLKRPLPDWMVARLAAGAKFVEFDSPKDDRQGIWAGGRRAQAAKAQKSAVR